MEFMPAPFWRRVVARTIDMLVCIPLTFIAAIPLVILLLPLLLITSDDAASSLGAFLCFFVAYTLVEYFLLRRRSGQTLGKGLLGLRVLDTADTDGTGAISARTALLRMLVLMGPLMGGLAMYYITYDEELGTSESALAEWLVQLWAWSLVVSALVALVDRNARRGLHDLTARTRVVRAQRRGIDMREDLKMLVPGKVSLEKHTPPPVILTKRS